MPVIKLPAAKEPGTPITMRLEGEAIEQLKLKARRLSVQVNKDISYVDLIKSAIKRQFHIDVDDNLGIEPDKKNPKLIIPTSEPRGFWTEEKIAEFKISEVGKMIQKCIDEQNYFNFQVLWMEQFDLWMKHRCAAYRILVRGVPDKGKGFLDIRRDLAAVAHVVARRGGVPNQIMEEEQVLVPSFKIGGAPEIADAEINKGPHVLFSLMSAQIRAYQKELDSNVFKCLESAAESRGQEVTAPGSGVDPATVMEMVRMIAQHDVAPAFIICHPDIYCALHSFGRDFLDAPPIAIALANEEYGSLWGIPIIVSTRMPSTKFLLSAAPENVGVIGDYSSPKLTCTYDTHKNRTNFVFTGDVGICVVNDWAISLGDAA